MWGLLGTRRGGRGPLRARWARLRCCVAVLRILARLVRLCVSGLGLGVKEGGIA